MFGALARLCLALMLAVVVTGEAAFATGPCQHGGSIVPAATDEPAAAPCHEGATHHAAPAPAKTPAVGDAPDQTPGLTLCECAALLKSCSPATPAAGETPVAHASWTPSRAVAFLSHRPEPARPPPRA